MPGYFGMEPFIGDLVSPRINTEEHRVGQIKETTVFCLESQAVQRIIDQGDQRFAIHLFKGRPPFHISGADTVVIGMLGRGRRLLTEAAPVCLNRGG